MSVLLAISLSFLITYTGGFSYHLHIPSNAPNVEGYAFNDWDGDGILDYEDVDPFLTIQSEELPRIKDICPRVPFQYGYHGGCIPDLELPSDINLEDAVEESDFDELVEEFMGIRLDVLWPSVEITWQDANIQTCFDIEGGLRGYRLRMQYLAFYHRFQASLGFDSEFIDIIVAAVYDAAYKGRIRREVIPTLLVATETLATAAHLVYADFYEDYANTVQSVEDGEWCSIGGIYTN
ncbi:MAG: hypothetical protein F4X56_00310 [Gammaproteobacteria bacterium]|nr:hypothetical protein [Gammaproteobacteria bacterium]